MNKLIEIRKRLCRAVLLCMVVVASGVLLQGCVHDKELLGCPEGAPGTLTLKFNVLGSQPNSAATRAVLAGENNVKDIAVWLFNNESKCIYFRYIKAGAAQPTGQDWTSGRFNVSLPNVPELTAVAEMYIVANAEDNLNSWGVAGPTDQVGKSVDDIFLLFTTKASSGENAIESPLPMGAFWERAGAVVMSSPHTVGLGRSIARVNVTVKVDEAYSPGLAAKLKLDKAKVTLSNLVEHGCAVFEAERSPGESFKYAGIPYDNRDYSAYVLNPSKGIPIRFYSQTQPVAAVVGAIPSSYATLPFYINQRSLGTYQDPNKDKRVSVRLQVPYIDGVGVENDDNFYKAEIYNTDAPDEDRKYFIHPNRSYNLTLTIVGLGNEGVKAVIDCLPWDVEDKDLDAGKSFAVSNDHLEVYVGKDIELTATTVTTLGKSAGTVAASSGITVTSGATFSAFSTGENIKIKFTDDVTTNGTLTLTQDGVSKTISVTRKPALRPWQSKVADFAQARYTLLGTLGGSSDIRHSSSATNYAGANSAINANVSSPYFYAPLFKLNGGGGNRYFLLKDAGLAGTDNKSIRVYFHTENVTSFAPMSHYYVGAFWRNAQRGERLIQQWGAVYTGAWEAGVCDEWGADWAQLDGSYDGALPSNELAEANPVSGTNTYIKGTDNPRFRIGLRSANPNTPSAEYPNGKPRYGLAIVRYTDAGGAVKYSPIFLRQGEDADYVFAPTEGYAASYGDGLTTRPEAKKVSPFALQKNSNAGNGNASGNRNHSFLSYPTKIGTLFRTDLARSVHPGVKPYLWNGIGKTMHGGNLNSIASYPSDYAPNEPCPVGYTHMRDNDEYEYKFNTTYTGSNLRYSSFRQSLYYRPKKSGVIQSENFHDDNLPHSLMYADGYFDRQQLSKSQYATGYATQIIASNIDFAASGTVCFNPNTLNHVFIPGNGLLYYDNPTQYDGMDMRQVGTPILLVGIAHHPSIRYFWYFYEINSGSTYATMEAGGYGSTQWVSANYNCYNETVYPIRCVKD